MARHSPAANLKRSLSLRLAHLESRHGTIGPNTGRKFTDEHKAKLSISAKARVTEELRERFAQIRNRKGRPRIYPDRVLTKAEIMRRWRDRQRGIS